MPWGLKRYSGAGHLHFITSSYYHRHPWLGSAERRDLLLDVRQIMRQRYSFVVAAYVVMPEHFHLLISEPQDVTRAEIAKRCRQRPHFSQKNARNGAPLTTSPLASLVMLGSGAFTTDAGRAARPAKAAFATRLLCFPDLLQGFVGARDIGDGVADAAPLLAALLVDQQSRADGYVFAAFAVLVK